MKKVLLIEDKVPMVFIWEQMLTFAGVEVVSAFTLEDAEEKFGLGEWDAIVLDACLHSESSIDCLCLLAKIKETYKGPLIAASNEAENRKFQMENGCTHEAREGKALVPKLVLQILDLPMPLAQAA